MNPKHRAIIDGDGNIVLPVIRAEPQRIIEIEEIPTEPNPEPDQIENIGATSPIDAWTIVEDEINEQELPAAATANMHMEQARQVWSSVRGNLHEVAGDMLRESTKQYRDTFIDGTYAGAEAAHSLHGSMKQFWVLLKQPVWIPNRRKEPVQYSRGALFLIDTVRFGGTFALLFSALFIAMNYQSFTSIAYSYIEPLAQVTGIAQANTGNGSINGTLKSDAGSDDVSQFLPPVGPPEHRLVIPKLDLNVPIVIPPLDALIAEDWKQLEEEIQTALRGGVVHYPGTARPGKPGNFFVTGHSSYFPWDSGHYKSIFARLGELEVGDEYWVFYNGDKYRYVVQSTKEIKPSDVSVLDQPIDQRISTLMTCTPIGTTLRRLIITAQEVDPVSRRALEVGEYAEEMPKIKMEALPI